MSNQAHQVVPLFGRVRGAFWALLIVSLVMAMAYPTITLLHAASTSLAVHACISPPAPRAQSTAHVLIKVLNTTDRTALYNPSAQIAADWDMATMSMGRQHVALPGPSSGKGLVAVPLALSMAGLWWVHVSVNTPGRPSWQAQLAFSVLPAVVQTGPPTSGASAVTVAAATCELVRR
jgi:hypothetical protein